MDSRKRLKNAFEDILATTFSSDEYLEVYAVSDAGLLLNDVPGEDTGRTPTLMANLMAAAEALREDALVKVSDSEGFIYLHRVNRTSFLAVKTSRKAKDDQVLERIEESARRIKNEIAWLR